MTADTHHPDRLCQGFLKRFHVGEGAPGGQFAMKKPMLDKKRYLTLSECASRFTKSCQRSSNGLAAFSARAIACQPSSGA
jgi:hypothetical protein